MKKVLIIEDQAIRFGTIISRLDKLLSEKNARYKLIVESSWVDALKKYRKSPRAYALIILDVRMPAVYLDEMVLSENGKRVPLPSIHRKITDFNSGTTTGFEVYHQIKEIRPNQEILFWTVLNKSEFIDAGIDIDNKYYVGKDADYYSFFEKLDEILELGLTDLFLD